MRKNCGYDIDEAARLGIMLRSGKAEFYCDGAEERLKKLLAEKNPVAEDVAAEFTRRKMGLARGYP